MISTAGNAWRTQILKRLLLSATLSGQREHEGKLYPGTWEPIFSPDNTERLRRMFAANPGVGRTRSATKSLLTGLARCGICGQRMFTNNGPNRRRRYTCTKRPGNTDTAGGVTTLADPLDEFVAQMVFAAVKEDALAQALRARGEVDDGLAGERATGRSRAGGAGERLLRGSNWSAGRSSSRRVSALTARLDVNRAKLARRDHRDVLAPFVGESESLRAAWALGSLDWRRAIVRVSLERVEIAPATEKGRKPFDPKRVRPVWRY